MKWKVIKEDTQRQLWTSIYGCTHKNRHTLALTRLCQHGNNKQKAQGKISEYSCTITAAPSRQETLILIWMYPNSLSPFFPSFSLSLSHKLINHNIIHLEMYLQNLGHKSNQIKNLRPKESYLAHIYQPFILNSRHWRLSLCLPSCPLSLSFH